MIRIPAAVTAAFLISAAASYAQETFREIGDWTIVLDRSGRICKATQKSQGSGGLVMQMDGGSLTISVLDQKLSWLEPGQQYKTEVTIDRSRWTGTMAASQTDRSGGLNLVSPAARFVTAFEQGSRISFAVDGTRYGPYSLKGSRDVINGLKQCFASATAPVETAPEPATGGTGNLVDGYTENWDEKDIGRLYTDGDITLRMQSRENLDDTTTITVEVHKKGMNAVSFDIEGSFTPSGQLGLVKMQPWSDEPQLLFTNFTGGAHCCTEARAVDFSGGQAKLIEFGSFDGSGVDPEDLDGDSYFEIVVPDERFRAFSAYANSFPPNIYAVEDGKASDVTKRPQFANYHTVLYRQQAQVCGTVARSNPGACAGLAGTAANLGLLEETLAMLDLESKPESDEDDYGPFFICEDKECSETKEIADYKEALLYALEIWDKPVAQPSSSFTQYMSKLVGRRFGDIDKKSETSCESGPVSFTQMDGPLGGKLFGIDGYESGCVVANGMVTGSALLVRAVCQGEGLPPEVHNRLYSVDGTKLSASYFEGTAFPSGYVSDMLECEAGK